MSEEAKTTKTPNCIGIIPDGNRRFAKEQGLATLEGHKAGAEKLKEVLEWCKEAGIKNAVVYAFSTENWNRPEEEVAYLLEHIEKSLREYRKRGEEEQRISVRFLGDIDRFGAEFAEEMRRIEEETKGREYHLYVALSYGGRAEILEGVKKAVREKDHLEVEKMTEEDFGKMLWTADMPDPDLIIRTSGEKRLSGFMTWASVYSELSFVDSNFPAFSKDEFFAVLQDYSERERRRGK